MNTIPKIITNPSQEPISSYIPRALVAILADCCSSMQPSQNVFQKIFIDHFEDFKEQYDEKFSTDYGNFCIDRITAVATEFMKCGDYKEGLARIKCQNPECGHDYFVPLSCKGFYLCPSCHQKRTLVFGEQMVQDVLLRLPHRQFVFTLPKCLRIFFKHNRLLFSDISNLIFDMIQSYYNEAANKKIETGMILSYQTSGDFARWYLAA